MLSARARNWLLARGSARNPRARLKVPFHQLIKRINMESTMDLNDPAIIRLREEIHTNHDWPSILGKFDIPFKIKPSGSLLASCCFHAEHTPSLKFWPDSGNFHCFGCGASGDKLVFIGKKLFGRSFSTGSRIYQHEVTIAQRFVNELPRRGHDNPDQQDMFLAFRHPPSSNSRNQKRILRMSEELGSPPAPDQ